MHKAVTLDPHAAMQSFRSKARRISKYGIVGASVCGVLSFPGYTNIESAFATVFADESPAPSSSTAHGSVVDIEALSGPTGPSQSSAPKEMYGAFRSFTLGEVIPLTRDVALFRFLLPTDDSRLTVAPCTSLEARFYMDAKIGSVVTRHYTPISIHSKGYFDIVVRKQSRGKMTNHLFGMMPGDEIEFRLAPQRLQYKPNKWKEIGMICGGTGITPMMQILTQALDSDPTDKTRFSMVFCNRTEENVFLKTTLDDYEKRFPDRFRVTYGVDMTLDPATWGGFEGFADEDVLRKTMPKRGKGSIILLSGPDEMLGHIAGAKKSIARITSSSRNVQPRTGNMQNMYDIGGLLKDMGYEMGDVHMF